jgi:hypothetical protein
MNDLNPILCFGVVFLIIAAILLLAMLKNKKKADASQSWPAVPGTLTRAGLSMTYHRGRSGTSRSYNPSVEYEYLVQGQTYRGKRIRFGGVNAGSRNKAQEVLNRVQSSPLVVHYNPLQPDESTLETEFSTTLPVVGIAIFGVLGLIALIAGLAG